MTVVPGSTLNTLAPYAVRYALGRATYAVADVVDVLLANLPALTQETRRQIAEDIERYQGSRGMPMDEARWWQLHKALKDG